MAKVLGPAHSTVASGSLGNTIYSRNRSGFYAYEKPVLSPSDTTQQQAFREAFQICSDAWDSAPQLTQSVRDQWANFASLYPRYDRLGREIFWKPRQWFIHVNLFKHLAGFGLKYDVPVHASCAFYPIVEISQSEDGLIATLSEEPTSESICYFSVVANQSLARNFCPKIESFGTLHRFESSHPFVIFPDDYLLGEKKRHFVRYKFVDTRGIQSSTQTDYIDCAKWYLPASVPVTKDTFIFSSAPTTNWGDGVDCHCWDNGGEIIHSLFWFDVSQFTPGNWPISATLHVYCKGVSVSGTCQSFHVLTEWEHLQATYNKRLSSSEWGIPGGQTGTDFLIDPSDSTLVDSADQFFEFDITNIVTSWLQGYTPNYGVFLRPASENCKVSFWTSDYGVPEQRPYVTFEW